MARVGDVNFDFGQLDWQASASAESDAKSIVEVVSLDPDIPVHAECIAALFANVTDKPDIRVLVRDQHKPQQVLAFTQAEWDAFVLGAKGGEFDLTDEPKA